LTPARPAPAGPSLDQYRAPLVIAWQLTNRCEARCLACCEESGPDARWRDELGRDEAFALVDQIIGLGVPYVVFGGGEPMSVPYFWDIFSALSAAGVSIKIETNGRHIDAAAAARLHDHGVGCVQISLDGPTAATHERSRPGSSFAHALAAIDRLVAAGTPPQLVFVPTRLNIDEMVATYELAVARGCAAFITGPLMRLGRAGAAWDRLACDDGAWGAAVAAVRRRAAEIGAGTPPHIYPWDILGELERRVESPQAMLLVVPNGRVKLLNALPYAVADLRRDSLARAWLAYRDAWRAPLVRDFIANCRADPTLLRHANELWDMPRIPALA
jgi:MoaA/NifB/PqqE/SkfB family radical SAM enzyme